MGLSSNATFEIRTSGNDTNGGGFSAGSATGVDYSQQDNPQYAVTDASCTGNFNITSPTANFGTDVIGNICYFAGGTGNATPRWWQITARPNNTTITVDSRGYNPGVTTNATLRIGGALATPGGFGQIFIGGPDAGPNMTAWIKAGTYTLTNNTPNTPGGPIFLYSGSGFAMGGFFGYDQVRGDSTGVRPIISAGSISNIVILRLSAYAQMGQYVRNIEIDGNNQTNVVGTGNFYASYGTSIIRDCIYRNCVTGIQGMSGGEGATVFTTQCINCTTGFFDILSDSCEAISCSTGFSPSNFRAISSLRNCLARDCTIGFNGRFAKTISSCLAVRCGTGFSSASASDPVVYVDCLAALCTGRGWNIPYGANFNCASFSNGLANILPPVAGNVQSSWPFLTSDHITLTANPFIDSTNNDFRLNNTAGGGASLRNTGLSIPSQSLKRQIGPMLYDAGSGGGGGVFDPLNHPLIN